MAFDFPTEIIFVRHAESVANTLHAESGHPGSTVPTVAGRDEYTPLSERGMAQAAALGSRFSYPFDIVYCSPTLRTRETARIFFENYPLADRIDPIVDPRLTEKTQGDWEGQPFHEIFTPELKKQINWEFVPGDEVKGESHKAVAERMVEWVKDVTEIHKGQKVLAFTHGNALRFLLAELFDTDRNTAFKRVVDNTAVFRIQISADHKYMLILDNDTSHLIS